MARTAEEQWGVVSVAQLRAAGVSDGAIKHQAGTGRLRRLHRGVYAVGHAALRPEGRWLAAVLACGDDALLSHASAAALWGIRPTSATVVHVTVGPAMRTHPAGIRVHRIRRPQPQDAAVCDGIPVTSIARTLLDLAATLPAGALETAVAHARRHPRFDADRLAELLGRTVGHRGRRALSAWVAAEPRITRSRLEERFLELVRSAGLPEPETNVAMTLGGGEQWELDALWRSRRVSVELDSWRFHAGRHSFEADRARAATLTAAGYRHLQFTYRQLVTDPDAIARTLRTLLGG